MSSSVVNAESFKCAFIKGKYKGSKYNYSQCSMFPEVTFSNKYSKKEVWEHCESELDNMITEYRKVHVDTEDKTITWVVENSFSDTMIEYSIKEEMKTNKLNREEATKKVNEKFESAFQPKFKGFNITSHTIQELRNPFDPITEELIKNPSIETLHILNFTEIKKETSYSNFTMSIHESNNQAMLMEHELFGSSSWVNISYGKCSKI
jgi:hypothetical protein